MFQQFNEQKIIFWGLDYSRNPLSNIMKIIFAYFLPNLLFYNEDIMKSFTLFFSKKTRCYVANNTVDVKPLEKIFFDKRSDFIFVGSFDKRKNLEMLIDCVSYIRNHNCVQAAISIVQRTAVGAIVKVSTFTGTDEGHVGHNANRARQHRLECTEKNTKILENYDSVLNAVQLALRQICPKQYYLATEGSVPLTNAGLSIQTLTQFQAVLEGVFLTHL